mgnify:CR=1 FL=1
MVVLTDRNRKVELGIAGVQIRRCVQRYASTCGGVDVAFVLPENSRP